MAPLPPRKPPRSVPDDAPMPSQPTPDPSVVDAERLQRRLQQRAEQIAASHWQVHVCLRGHVSEMHRATAPSGPEGWRCPRCGAPAQREAPAQTAAREHQEASTPLAIFQRAGEAIQNWALDHLNAATWTQRSDQARAARERADEYGQGYRYHDI